MIRFTCECGKLLQAREEQVGRSVACPACGSRLTVPDTSTAVQPGQPERGPSPAPSGVRKGPGASPAEAEGRPAATSGKAVVSLVLGVLSFCALFLTGLPAALFGFLALNDIKKGQGRVKGKGLAITGLALGVVGSLLTCACVPLGILLWPAAQNVTEASARMQSTNNLKQMALAMLNYEATYRSFPPAGFRAPNAPPGRPGDKPLLSWRVALLPFVEEIPLYQQFHHDEPWDSPHNKALLPRIPKIYLLPGETAGPGGLTRYQVFVGPRTMFEEGQRIGIAQVPDGMSNTLLVVEAVNGVPWTKPEDLRFDPRGPLPPLGGRFRKGFHAAFADGRVALIPRDTPEATLKALITRNGGELVNPP